MGEQIQELKVQIAECSPLAKLHEQNVELKSEQQRLVAEIARLNNVSFMDACDQRPLRRSSAATDLSLDLNCGGLSGSLGSRSSSDEMREFTQESIGCNWASLNGCCPNDYLGRVTVGDGELMHAEELERRCLEMEAKLFEIACRKVARPCGLASFGERTPASAWRSDVSELELSDRSTPRTIVAPARTCPPLQPMEDLMKKVVAQLRTLVSPVEIHTVCDVASPLTQSLRDAIVLVQSLASVDAEPEEEADSAFEPRLANNVPFDLESSPEDTLEAEARAERDQLLDQLAMASSKLGAQHQQLAELTLEKTELQTVQVRTSGPKEEDVGNNFLDDGRGHVGEQASVQTRESLAGNSAIEATAGEPTELLQRDEIQDQSLAEDVTMQHVVDEGLVHGTGVVVEFQEGFSSDTVKDACHAVDELNSQCDGAQEVPTLECSIVTAANLRAEIQHLMDAVHAKKNEHAQALVDCDRQRFDLWQLHLNTEDLHARASELRDAQLVRGTIPSEEEEEVSIPAVPLEQLERQLSAESKALDDVLCHLEAVRQERHEVGREYTDYCAKRERAATVQRDARAASEEAQRMHRDLARVKRQQQLRKVVLSEKDASLFRVNRSAVCPVSP